ncbi:MAG: prepilin peptidase [Sphingobium sp.]|nr:prepilin peptidase [Sphingobium sp.]
MSDAARLLIGAGFGLIIGSFLATIVSRWPRGESVVRGRSRCDGCGRALTVVDLVPLVGWLIARGKCRTCGARIDPVHPLVEIGAALIGAFCAWAFPPIPALFLATGGWTLLTLAVLDARHLWLPDLLTLPLAALGLTLGDWVLPAQFMDRAIGAAAGAGFLFLLAAGFKRLRGKDGLGLGDAKLLGAVGAWLGWQALPFVLLLASVTALLWVGALQLTGRRFDNATRVPLGTFLCFAVVPAWIFALSLGS